MFIINSPCLHTAVCRCFSLTMNTFSFKEWESFVDVRSKVWKHLMEDWIKQFHDPILVLRYENLVSDLEKELKKIDAFLNLHAPDDRLKCVLNNPGDIYKVTHPALAADPYTKEQRYAIEELINDVNLALSRRSSYGYHTFT